MNAKRRRADALRRERRRRLETKATPSRDPARPRAPRRARRRRPGAQVLEAAPDADARTLRQNYKRLSLATHPDKNPGVDPAAFDEVRAAWEALSDEKSRDAYDATLAPAAVVVWADVALGDFDRTGDGALTYGCRCGGAYELWEDELAEGVDVVPCDGCSLYVRVRRPPCR